jgi:hypothetical protein
MAGSVSEAVSPVATPGLWGQHVHAKQVREYQVHVQPSPWGGSAGRAQLADGLVFLSLSLH